MISKITQFMFVLLLLIVFSTLAVAGGVDYFAPATKQHEKAYHHFAQVNHLDKILPHLAADRVQYAIDELRYTLNAFPNHPRALMLVKPVENAAKRVVFGVAPFEHALSLYPQYAITHAQYGWYLVESNLLPAGIGKLKQAIEMDPKLVTAYVWLSRAYSKAGNSDLAREAAQQARDLGFTGQIGNEK
jgi:Tfp pilus assembly protein PilF